MNLIFFQYLNKEITCKYIDSVSPTAYRVMSTWEILDYIPHPNPNLVLLCHRMLVWSHNTFSPPGKCVAVQTRHWIRLEGNGRTSSRGGYRFTLREKTQLIFLSFEGKFQFTLYLLCHRKWIKTSFYPWDSTEWQAGKFLNQLGDLPIIFTRAWAE